MGKVCNRRQDLGQCAVTNLCPLTCSDCHAKWPNNAAHARQKPFPLSERHVKTDKATSNCHKENHCKPRCNHRVVGDENITKDVVGEREDELVGANAHGDPGKAIIGLPILHGLSHQLDVSEVPGIAPDGAIQLEDLVASAFEAPRVRRSVSSSWGISGASNVALPVIFQYWLIVQSRASRRPSTALLCRGHPGILQHRLLGSHGKRDTEHLPRLDLLERRAICASAFELCPRWNRKSDKLRQ
mmetsp:Transcript_156289/g.271921  ORF Transcript_156289/g.271921 Transcript_156289/m.271921 type:complete len:243 (+) Transcript_156289:1692-2420(+)